MVTNTSRLDAADARHEQALAIVDRLDLLGRWKAIGNPVLVGSVALDVVVKPDIDLAVFVDDFSPRQGFDALMSLVDDAQAEEISYVDARRQPINGLYWRLRVLDDGEPWQVDIWLLTRDRDQDGEEEVTRAARLQADAIRRRPEARDTILRIKHEARSIGQLAHGRWVYEAVVDYGIESYDAYLKWMGGQDASERSTWIPKDSR